MDETLTYPDYYTVPFHSYDEGNLDWKAAYEVESSTASMTSAYWPGTDYAEAAQYVRGNFTELVDRFAPSPRRILDVGCSTGISTAYLAAAYPSTPIVGVDLSPHFLSVAKDTTARTFPGVKFVHANAERLPFGDESFDLICMSYVTHELPGDASQRILEECKRVLAPEGVVAIVDLDPIKLRERLDSRFRRWLFEATEPHIYDYYDRPEPGLQLLRAGFTRIGARPNDPLNTAWVGTKP